MVNRVDITKKVNNTFYLYFEIAVIEAELLRAMIEINNYFIKVLKKGKISLKEKNRRGILQEFLYLYNNCAFRFYILREKIIQLLNIALEIDLDEKDVRFNLIIRNKKTIEKGISFFLEKFNCGYLKEILDHRRIITHLKFDLEIKGHILRSMILDVKDEKSLIIFFEEKINIIKKAYEEANFIKKNIFEKLEIEKIIKLCMKAVDLTYSLIEKKHA